VSVLDNALFMSLGGIVGGYLYGVISEVVVCDVAYREVVCIRVEIFTTDVKFSLTALAIIILILIAAEVSDKSKTNK